MEIKKGIGVSPGVVISMAVVLDAEDLVIPKRAVGPDGVNRRSPDTIAPSIWLCRGREIARQRRR